MMKLVRIRPSSMTGHLHPGPTRAPDIEADAGDDQRDEDKRHRTQEEARAINPDRFLKRIFCDLPQYHADDERRARPIMTLEEITQAAHDEHKQKVLPLALVEIAAEQSEHQDIGDEEARLGGAELSNPGPGS